MWSDQVKCQALSNWWYIVNFVQQSESFDLLKTPSELKIWFWRCWVLSRFKQCDTKGIAFCSWIYLEIKIPSIWLIIPLDYLTYILYKMKEACADTNVDIIHICDAFCQNETLLCTWSKLSSWYIIKVYILPFIMMVGILKSDNPKWSYDHVTFLILKSVKWRNWLSKFGIYH